MIVFKNYLYSIIQVHIVYEIQITWKIAWWGNINLEYLSESFYTPCPNSDLKGNSNVKEISFWWFRKDI